MMDKLNNPRTVKIFFSSPFGGMEEEREELTRKYFPRIHNLCNSHGLQFAAVDMRWGITSESSDKAQVINICLREIDRSDMFIGFFGQRYGWHGAKDEALQKNFDNALSRYPWLDDVRDRSVTELEFLHGFLNNPGHIPAALFFRDKSYDDIERQKGVEKGDKKQVFKYSAESDEAVTRMNDLKQRVEQKKDKSLGVYLSYKTPAEAVERMFEIIMDHLNNVLLKDDDKETKRSVTHDLRLQHDAFMASRSNVYVHGEEYMKVLNQQLNNSEENRQHVLVTGAPGSGKSAILCNWINAIQTDRNVCVVYHFIGFAENSTEVSNMLERLVTEFEETVATMIDGHKRPKIGDKKIEEDDMQAIQALMLRLTEAMNKLISLNKTPVLVIDGLDKISVVRQIRKVLYYLPTNLPRSSLVVVSTQDTDTPRIEELTARNYCKIHIEPLPQRYRHQLCLKTLEASGKELSPPQLERIVAAEQTHNPLFLKITMEELISFGYFRLLDKKIDMLITSESIVHLFEHVISRLEEDYNVEDYRGNLVEQVLCCLELCNQGMVEEELMTIFSIPGHVWSPFYFAIEKLVLNQSGRIQFAFKELGSAVVSKYFKDPDKRKYYLEKMAEYFSKCVQETHKTMQLDGADLKVYRPAYELPYIYKQLDDTTRAAQCLSDFFIFSHLEFNSKYHLAVLWQWTEYSISDISSMLIRSFDERIAVIYTILLEKNQLQTSATPGFLLHAFLRRVHNFLEIMGDRGLRTQVIERSMKNLEEGFAHGVVDKRAEMEDILREENYKLACSLCESHHTAERGIQLHMKLMQAEKKKMNEHGGSDEVYKNLGSYCHGIGVGYIHLGNNQKALEYTEMSVEYHLKTSSPDMSDIAVSWGNISHIYLGLDQHDKALEYILKSIQTLKDHYIGEEPPIIGEMLTNQAIVLRNMGRLDEAEEAYKRSLAIKIKALGKDHRIVAMAFMNVGTLEAYRGNFSKSLEYSIQAQKIFETIGQTWDDIGYFMVMENVLSFTLKIKDDKAAIDEEFMTVLEHRIEDKSMDGCMVGLYQTMALHYLNTEQNEKAYKVAYALLGSKFADDSEAIPYLIVDSACRHLPAEYRDKLPENYTLKFAIEKFPSTSQLVTFYCRNYLMPVDKSDVEGMAELLNNYHDRNDAGSAWYTNACVMCNAEDNLICLERVLNDGLQRYPSDLELNLEMAKLYRKQDRADLAFPHADMVGQQLLDSNNPSLLSFVAQTAALAARFDDCDKYCKIIRDKFPDDENTMQSVGNLESLVLEAREAMKEAEEKNAQKTGENDAQT